MDGTIGNFQLNINHIFNRMETYFGKSVVYYRENSEIKKITFRELSERIRKTANYLIKTGIGQDDTVATLSWNTIRHLELYFAVPLIGAVLNTINIKYHRDVIKNMIRENNAKLIFYEGIPEDILEGINIRSVKMDQAFDDNIYSSEIEKNFPDNNEKNAAIICYTSGTTGNPKGVVYTHRSIFIHSLSLLGHDSIALSRQDTSLVMVPMYHISGWDIPFAAALTGSNLALPGVHPDPPDIVNMISSCRVNKAFAAPAVWTSIIEYSISNETGLEPLKYAGIGGAEPSDYIIKTLMESGIETWHLWGMTETEAIATISKPETGNVHNQGIPMPAFEINAVDEKNNKLPWDGKSTGELLVRGAYATSGYFHTDSTDKIVYMDGKTWIRTGDIVKINPDGSIKIVDRDKDLIKSGGEWISSIDLENTIMEHPGVLEAAVIAKKDDRWGERPLALVVKKASYRKKLDKNSLREYLISLDRFPKWWIPDDFYFVDEIPKTGTGKFDKKLLRSKYSK
ncbi:AMP-binding protein [Acidiplasma sp.]|uniref:AMP-binding protein n=1 Tax=Acidiplasma sp. TaxID=1872114 RepID=UPI00258C8DA5|nr:AMP-binding protein [Acidiplasma sp.]